MYLLFNNTNFPFLWYLGVGKYSYNFLERLLKLQKGLQEILHFPISEIILLHYSKI